MAIKNIIIVIYFFEATLFFIKFIFYITDHLFQNIFKCYNSTGATKFVYYYSEMNAFRLKLFQEVFNQFIFMYKVGLAHYGMPVEIIVAIQIRQNVFCVDNANYF